MKYDADGAAQWAQTVAAGGDDSLFTSVAVDSSGNYNAAGQCAGTGTFDFGNGRTVTGSNTGDNLILVKYGAGGTAQWARTANTTSGGSLLNGVAVDSTGGIYAAGYVNGTGSYDFGNGTTISGSVSSSSLLLVKYDPDGLVLWAQTVPGGPDSSRFDCLSVHPSSQPGLYAAGRIMGTGAFDFGNGVTASGIRTGYHIVLVKYSGEGM